MSKGLVARDRFIAAGRRWAPGDTTADRQNFGKMLLVFSCIGSDFCKKICVLQHFSKSTRFSSWNFWNLTKCCKFCDICKFFDEISRKLLFFQSDFFCENFEIAAVHKYANLVELETCCQTRIFLQTIVLIQPRTSPLKICKILPPTARCRYLMQLSRQRMCARAAAMAFLPGCPRPSSTCS